MLCDMVRRLPWYDDVMKNANVLGTDAVRAQKRLGVGHYLTITFAGITSRERRTAISTRDPMTGLVYVCVR